MQAAPPLQTDQERAMAQRIAELEKAQAALTLMPSAITLTLNVDAGSPPTAD